MTREKALQDLVLSRNQNNEGTNLNHRYWFKAGYRAALNEQAKRASSRTAHEEPFPSGCTPCADCGIDYAAYCGAWLVADAIWQRVVGTDPTVVLCPSCFAVRAAREVEELPGDGQRLDDILAAAAIMVGTLLDVLPADRREWLNDLVAKQGAAFPGAERLQRASETILREVDEPLSQARNIEREHEPASECGKPDRWSGLPCVREPGHQLPCQAHARFVAYPDDRVTGKHAAEVLAKALDEFFTAMKSHRQEAPVYRLKLTVYPTLQALGYGKKD